MKSDYVTTWKKEELKTYILIFSMNADFVETKEEVELIKSKTSESIFEAMYNEFQNDNDYESIQKIQNTVERLEYTQEQIQALFEEIKTLFKADGSYDILERNLTLGLKKVLKS